jgi:hypothetical protein
MVYGVVLIVVTLDQGHPRGCIFCQMRSLKVKFQRVGICIRVRGAGKAIRTLSLYPDNQIRSFIKPPAQRNDGRIFVQDSQSYLTDGTRLHPVQRLRVHVPHAGLAKHLTQTPSQYLAW